MTPSDVQQEAEQAGRDHGMIDHADGRPSPMTYFKEGFEAAAESRDQRIRELEDIDDTLRGVLRDDASALFSRDQRIEELEAVVEAAKNYDENWLAGHMVAWAGDNDISDREVGEAEEAAHSLHAALAALKTVTPQAEQER